MSLNPFKSEGHFYFESGIAWYMGLFTHVCDNPFKPGIGVSVFMDYPGRKTFESSAAQGLRQPMDEMLPY